MADPLETLLDHRFVVYALGVVAIAGLRRAPLSPRVGTGAVGVVLVAMAGTYLAERVADRGIASRRTFAIGAVGIAAGIALSLSRTLVGLAFIAGGLLFVNTALADGDRS